MPGKPTPDDDPPDLNTGSPWTEDAIQSLEWFIENGESIKDIARFLCRRRAEIRDKMDELGLKEARSENGP